ncbi:response regulator transcription factor, partial [Pseudomonas aeruginosa]
LTPRQQAVLRLIADGLSNKEIGRALSISPFTVRVHVSSLLRALEVNTRTAAATGFSAARRLRGKSRQTSRFGILGCLRGNSGYGRVE